jgi:hypothetical protein
VRIGPQISQIHADNLNKNLHPIARCTFHQTFNA